MEALSCPLTYYYSMVTRPGIVLEQPFVGTPRLRIAHKRQGAFPKPRLMLQELRAQTSGTVKTMNETASDNYREEPKEFQKSATTSGVEGKSNDNQLVFVAGATGKVGSRTVRELLKLGFRVRAGVRSLQKANALLESVRQLKLDSQDTLPSAAVGPTTEQKIEIVECDLEKPYEIGLAISNAGVVVCCVGASEKEVFDVTGPYRIDYQATKNLIDAATVAKVNHFILLTSLGTNKVGFPAALLNLFWGVLIWKRKAEQALINSGLPYTIVRPGGMERPTDAYKETHNLVLASADTYFGGQVSNLQVAELIACMAKNRELSMNKVVEVIAETTAPLLAMEELLVSLSSANGVSKFSSQEKELTKEVVKSASETLSSVEQDPLQSAVSTVPEKAELQMVSEKSRPLSPYTMYEDLKPPTSPCPSTPNLSLIERSVTEAIESTPQNQFSKVTVIAEPGAAQKKEIQISHSQSRPLSPYPMYEDLKPPTSPCPSTPNLSLIERSMTEAVESTPQNQFSKVTVIVEPGAAQKEEIQISHSQSRPLSPYPMYEDLKPPTSPCPSTPNLSLIERSVTEAVESTPQNQFSKVTVIAEPGAAQKEEIQISHSQSRPLSPYPIYISYKPSSDRLIVRIPCLQHLKLHPVLDVAADKVMLRICLHHMLLQVHHINYDGRASPSYKI